MKLSALHYTGLAFLVVLVLFAITKLPDYVFGEKPKKYCNKKQYEFKDENYKNTLFDDDQYDYVNSTHPEDSLMSFDEILKKEEFNERLNADINKNLIRKRRFLIFPEGSSLQLVFCLTYFTIIPLGDLFYMGATASLAWELPQDPYSSFEHHADALHRKDKGPVVYKDIKGPQRVNSWGNRILVNRLSGKPIQPSFKNYYKNEYQPNNKNYNYYKNSYRQNNKENYKNIYQSNINKQNYKTKTSPAKQRQVIKPVFAKRSTNNDKKSSGNERKKRIRKKRITMEPGDKELLHRKQEQRKYLKSQHMDTDALAYHKSSRYKLYEKLEKLFIGAGHNGKECVLKALCEIGQNIHGKQGTFLEEIIRVIFTLPKSSRYQAKYLHYDQAHVAKYKCEDVYPKCTISVKTTPV